MCYNSRGTFVELVRGIFFLFTVVRAQHLRFSVNRFLQPCDIKKQQWWYVRHYWSFHGALWLVRQIHPWNTARLQSVSFTFFRPFAQWKRSSFLNTWAVWMSEYFRHLVPTRLGPSGGPLSILLVTLLVNVQDPAVCPIELNGCTRVGVSFQGNFFLGETWKLFDFPCVRIFLWNTWDSSDR